MSWRSVYHCLVLQPGDPTATVLEARRLLNTQRAADLDESEVRYRARTLGLIGTAIAGKTVHNQAIGCYGEPCRCNRDEWERQVVAAFMGPK